MWSWTYFIQSQSAPWLVKIGKTKSEPLQRLSSLQTSSPSELKLVLALQGLECVEPILHLAFREYHVRGEWFRPSKRLSDFVRECRAKKIVLCTPEVARDLIGPMVPDEFRAERIDFIKSCEYMFSVKYSDLPWINAKQRNQAEIVDSVIS